MKSLKITKNILNEKSDVLTEYFKDIGKYEILSQEEEFELATLVVKGKKAEELLENAEAYEYRSIQEDIEKGEEAKTKLINCNLRFVVTCAKQYVNQGVALIDLIEAGNEGLIIAVNKFIPEKGFRLLSFAVWYIRREILKEIYNTGKTIRYPITFISRISKVKKAYDKFVKEHECEPTDEELLEMTNLTQKQYNKVVLDKSYCQSLDTPLYEDVTLQDTIPNNDGEDNFLKDALLTCISRLNSREQKVIKEYFGIGCPAKKIQEIAEEMKLGPERIRQLKKGALKKLEKFKSILQIYAN